MKRLAALLIVAACFTALHTSALAADPADCKTRPSWCSPGFVCLPSACAAESAAQLGLLTAMLENAQKLKPPRFHADLTCGPGIGTALDKDFRLHIFPTTGSCVVGLAIRLGR